MNRHRILLIDPMPPGSLQPPFPVLPFGLSCIASIAHAEDADVRVLWGQNLQEPLDRLLKTWKPDCAGFQTFVNTMWLCRDFARKIRSTAPDCLIVFGGVEASNNPEQSLQEPAVDAVITGEGEMQFKLLLERLGDDPISSPGLVHRDESGRMIRNQGKCLFENLDDLPEIPYRMFYGDGPVPVGHMLTHRGCPFHCSHCPLRFRAGVPIRSHSAERIGKTVRRLYQDHQIHHLEFFDENFTMDPDHVLAICEEISSLPLTFSCTARISQVSVDLCSRMAAAGCSRIVFGLGTGISKHQKTLGTHENLDHARRLIAELQPMGIIPEAVFSMGLPGETREDFRATVSYALSLKNCRVRFEPAAPLPGSELHRTAQNGGRFLIRSWDDYIRPNQVIYLPAGWSKTAFYTELYRAKLLARLKTFRAADRLKPARRTNT